MDRIVITIRPTPSDAEKLRVTDAMQQVIDAIKLFEDAERGVASPHEAFEWRLERATTNSPFTVIATAEPKNPKVNVAEHVRRVKREVAHGLRNLITHGTAPKWMSQDTAKVVRGVFARNQNGIGETDIDFEMEGEVLAIDRTKAEAGLRALEAINVMDLEAEIPERESYGEIEGVMVAAGRYQRRPAIQIRSELYGFVWCPLSPATVQRFGSEHRMADIWEGKTVSVRGRLNYAKGGRLTKVEALDIREIEAAPPIDLESILDPDFTAGMDPREYLRKFHEGELA
jgi:hypothetical protein